MQHVLIDLQNGRYIAPSGPPVPKMKDARTFGTKDLAMREALGMKASVVPIKQRKGEA